ncbi:MAG: hypothetical protein ACRD2S_01000, partial [Terriglobales bacterium]
MHRNLPDSELESFPSLDWSAVAPRMSEASRTSLEQVLQSLDGRVLSLHQSLGLANAEGDDLLGLLVAANMMRSELVGNIVTYVVN